MLCVFGPRGRIACRGASCCARGTYLDVACQERVEIRPAREQRRHLRLCLSQLLPDGRDEHLAFGHAYSGQRQCDQRLSSERRGLPLSGIHVASALLSGAEH